MLIERRLEELGIILPKVPTPVGSYLPAVQMGDLLFLCGQGPFSPRASTPRASSAAASRSRRATSSPD